MEKENFEEFEDFNYEIELEKKFNISVWDSKDVCALLNITEEELNYLIERTGTECRNIGWKKSYNINFIKSFDEWMITTIGMYQLVLISSGLKRFKHFENYVSDFSEIAISDLIRYQGFKQNKVKKKSNNTSYDFEKQGEYNAKVIDKDLKNTDLELEDKSHLFYDKKVLITGTFENFEDRNQMAEMIKRVGGHNKGISKSLDFVIVGVNAGPSKMKKIEDYGIKILNENEFINLFEK